MKAMIPKSYNNLPESEKRKIKEIVADQLEKQLNEDEAMLQRVWIKMACIVLHEVYGFGPERLLRFIVRWKRMYHAIGRCTTNEEVREMLDGKIHEIYKDKEYPEEWVDRL